MASYLRGRKITSPPKKSQMGGKLKKWLSEGMPLPGAKKPPKGKTYLRGRLINIPKKSK